ncbi:ASCH domain-containing protein [Dokdonia sinensis]|uniref:ASCH domain-containing protein n=1 Tax=Dokdonia sinensis TaxID=2479847 RepID=A0A3M0GJQ9_9FLAO|nr:ASCH domain-containing protein [Dokdonia sinensis]RMB62872.1 ASCH domain-containing protein [Dokdonia sinensis]
MKYLLYLFLLFTISCNYSQKGQPDEQTVTSEESEIDASVIEMWNDYITANPEAATRELPESWFFHNNKADANRLGNLVAEGKKQAGSSLYIWYEEAGAPLPESGVKHIITDFDGKALAIIEIKKVDTIPFHLITPTYASLDMGTDVELLEKWREAHKAFFTKALAESGDTFTKDMLVVCEYFETVWPVSKNTITPNALSLALHPNSYALSALPDTVEATMYNTTTDTIITGLHYSIEHLKNGSWEDVVPDLIFNDIGYELFPNGAQTFPINLLHNKITYKKGSYRISKRYLKDDYHRTRKQYPVSANFTIF